MFSSQADAHSNGSKGWLILNKTSYGARLPMMRDTNDELQSDELNYIHLSAGIRLKSLCIPPVNAVLHGGQEPG